MVEITHRAEGSVPHSADASGIRSMADLAIQEFIQPALDRASELLEADPALALHSPDPSVTAAIKAPGLRIAEVVETIQALYADRPALGWRRRKIRTDSATGRAHLHFSSYIDTMSYRALGEARQALANYLHDRLGARQGSMAAMLGFTSPDYAIANLACLHLGLVTVPLQTTMPAADLLRIIGEVEPPILFIGVEQLENAISIAPESKSVEHIVVLDHEPGDDDRRARYERAVETLVSMGKKVATLADCIEIGRAMANVSPCVPVKENPLATLFYTSGSTGSPKGAMYPEQLLRGWWTEVGAPIPTIAFSYLPQNHAFGVNTIIRTLNRGGLVCFASSSDMSMLWDDVRLFRPTCFDFVPRIGEIVFHHYKERVSARLAARPDADPDAERAAVMADLREHYLGGRVCFSNIGTAPVAPELAQFITECFKVALFDGYGSTETGGMACNGYILNPPVVHYKLRDVPELGYSRADQPFPRGELLVKTLSAVPGYYKHPELTADLFEDGYIVTGDIVEENGPGRITYLDRRNNVLKLAHGEYVAIARLEAVFAQGDPIVRQIFVYGTGTRSYILAVVVPNLEVASQRLGAVPSDADLKKLVRSALQSVAQAEGLHAYEIPRDVLIETTPFSTENNLLSPVGKHLRPKLKARYGEALEVLYGSIEQAQLREADELRSSVGTRETLDIVCRALEVTLGIDGVSRRGDQSFADLGGDSLSAVTFSTLLEELFGVEITVGTILNPASTLADLASQVDLEVKGTSGSVSYGSIHDPRDDVIHATSLELEKFVDPRILEAAVTGLPEVTEIRNVLLTGATGFLGRFLCIEWFEKLVGASGRLICIIRARDDEMARVRLRDVLYPPALHGGGLGETLWRERFDDRLEVIAGDIAAPRLGLDADRYARLCADIDLIVHSASLVNHMLPYRQLFEPNVVGTARLVELALTEKLKRIDFVSSAALCYLPDGTMLPENGDVRSKNPVRRIDGSYANGYAISKWAGEVLLQEAHARFGVPVNIFRSDMILGHRHLAGQINVPDMFSRLLLSVLMTGMAPASFYEHEAGVRPHYAGLPVDFIAASMVAISLDAGVGIAGYNVANPHDDGISLDTFVDWLVEDGHDIERIGNYREWVGRFEQALDRLPDADRQHSSLAIIEQLRAPMRVSQEARIGYDLFRRRVGDLKGALYDADIPNLSRDFIRKYVNDFQYLGLLKVGETV